MREHGCNVFSLLEPCFYLSLQLIAFKPSPSLILGARDCVLLHQSCSLPGGAFPPNRQFCVAYTDIVGSISSHIQGHFEYWQQWLAAGYSTQLQSWFLSLPLQWYDRFHSGRALWARFKYVFPCCESGIKSSQIARAGSVNHVCLLEFFAPLHGVYRLI